MIRWGQSLFATTSHSLNVPNFPELGPARSKREQSGLFVAATTGRVRVPVPRPLHGTSNNPPVVPGRGHFGGRGESQAGGHHGDSPISPRSENVAVPNMGSMTHATTPSHLAFGRSRRCDVSNCSGAQRPPGQNDREEVVQDVELAGSVGLASAPRQRCNNTTSVDGLVPTGSGSRTGLGLVS